MLRLYFYILCIWGGIFTISASASQGKEAQYKNIDIWAIEEFIKRTKKSEITENDLRRYFYKEYKFNPKVIKLLKKGKRKRRLKARETLGQPVVFWRRYQKNFLRPKRVQLGIEHYKKHQKNYDSIAQEYQFPVSILLAVLGIETKYGEYQGKYNVRNTLITNSFHKDSHRKSFYQQELMDFLHLAQANPFLHQQKGSYAGAMGMGQFISSSYKKYAIDYNKDGIVDLFNSEEDTLASVANYLLKHKWKIKQPVAKLLYTFKHSQINSAKKKRRMQIKLRTISARAKQSFKGVKKVVLFKAKSYQLWALYHNFEVIKRYNNLHSYAMSVHQLSERIERNIKQ